MTEQEFQAELAKRDQQIQGLAAERNAERQRAQAWAKLGESFEPGVIQYDASGLPVGVAQPAMGGGANGAHPFSGLVSDPGSVDTWLNQQVNQEVFEGNAVITLPALGQKWVLTKGFLTSYPPIPDAKKVLQSRAFGITWERVRPAPTG